MLVGLPDLREVQRVLLVVELIKIGSSAALNAFCIEVCLGCTMSAVVAVFVEAF